MIKIYSERNSCSNYLMKLLEQNLDAEVVKTHQLPVYDIMFDNIIIVKNPYAWTLSLWKKPHGTKRFRDKYVYLKFDEFIRSEWRGYANAIERYNDCLNHYRKMLNEHPDVILIKSEDLQRNPKEIISKIAYNYDYTIRKFKDIKKEVNSGGNLVGTYDRRDYYLNEEWKKKLTRNDINFINRYLNDQNFEFFGYEKL